MARRPQLLFFSHIVPYPRDAGARIRTWYVLAELARSFAVEGVFLARSPANSHSDAVEALRQICSPTIVRISGGFSRRTSIAALRGAILDTPYTRYLYDSKRVTRRLQDISARCGLVHVDSIDLYGYLPLFDPRITCLSHHSVESEMLHRRASYCSNTVVRWGLQRQARLVSDVEKKWCDRVKLNVCVSARDAGVLRHNVPGASTVVAPNGVDVDFFAPIDIPGQRQGLLFVGGMDWAPNLDAVRYFVQHIQPLLGNRQTMRLDCVGHTTSACRSIRGVNWIGYVPDIRPLVRRATAVVVPLRVGGGTRLKILTAWAMGKAVVSTAMGAEGLAVRPGENILLADTPAEFADALARVEADETLAARLGRAGRATVEQLYDWRLIGERLRQRYMAISKQR